MAPYRAGWAIRAKSIRVGGPLQGEVFPGSPTVRPRALSALAQATEPHEPKDTRKQEDLAAGLGYLNGIPCVFHDRVRRVRWVRGVRIGPIDIV